jgi:hypothetical protein
MPTPQDETTLTLLKCFLYLIAIVFAAAASWLVIWLASAATVTGKTPFAPISLIDGTNTGVLGPGEQRWFKFTPVTDGQTVKLEKSLTLIFAPGYGNYVRNATMQIFQEDQIQFFYGGQTDQMNNLGAGQIVSRDNNPESGELFWTGWLFGQQNYFIELTNGNDSVIDYWLFTDNIISHPLGDPEPQNGAVGSVVNTGPAVFPGSAPLTALPLEFGQNVGGLDARDQVWYSFSIADHDSEYFEEMNLTLVVTPDNGNRIRNFTFDIYTDREIQNWLLGHNAEINNIGAGSVVLRDSNPETGERFWNGWVVDGSLYYVQIRNSTDTHMDYWLFTDDVYGPELGKETPR